MIEQFKKILPILIAITFLICSFVLDSTISTYGENASYVVETLLIVAALTVQTTYFRSLLNFPRTALRWSLISLLLGAVTIFAAFWMRINVPLDFTEQKTLVLLLLIAPLLEEFLFRFLMIAALRIYCPDWLTIGVSTLVFSYAHLHGFWQLPTEFHSFIFYQAFYTLILGFICGVAIEKWRSLPTAILIHFTFNLGFYLGHFLY